VKQPLFIIYHLFQVERWEQVFCEQIGAMSVSGLLSDAHLTIGVNGDLPLPVIPNCEVIRHVNGFSEKPSLLLAQETALTHPESYILYCHSKGISHPTRNQDDWRMMMQHFLIINWRLAVHQLADCELATVNWRTYPKPHPSGNHWWARADFLARLDSNFLDDSDRMSQEFWTGSIPCKVANLYESEKNHYSDQCLPSSYGDGYFREIDAQSHRLSYPSRATAIAQGILSPVHGVDYF
jgi:hypothetical protein